MWCVCVHMVHVNVEVLRFTLWDSQSRRELWQRESAEISPPATIRFGNWDCCLRFGIGVEVGGWFWGFGAFKFRRGWMQRTDGGWGGDLDMKTVLVEAIVEWSKQQQQQCYIIPSLYHTYHRVASKPLGCPSADNNLTVVMVVVIMTWCINDESGGGDGGW